MLWWGLIIYIIAAYVAFSTMFTPVIALIVYPGLRQQAGSNKLIYNILCILVGNIALVIFALLLEFTVLLVCTLVGEIILWLILTNIIKKEVIDKFNNKIFGFYPIFKSGLKNFLLQPFYWINSIVPTIFDVAIPVGGLFKIIIIPLLLLLPLFLRNPIVTFVDNTVIKDDCAIVIPNHEISIKSISNNEVSYTNNNGKKWTFSVKGDGLYIPEGEYIFLCDFSKSEEKGDKKYTYSVNDLEITGNMNKGKIYYLKYNLEKLEENKFRVSLFLEE